jgi:hypothetical protein
MSDEEPREEVAKKAEPAPPKSGAYRIGDAPLYVGATCVLTAGATVRRQDLENLGAKVLEALAKQGRAAELE